MENLLESISTLTNDQLLELKKIIDEKVKNIHHLMEVKKIEDAVEKKGAFATSKDIKTKFSYMYLPINVSVFAFDKEDKSDMKIDRVTYD